MIEVQGVPRVTYHNAFQISVSAEGDEVALVFTEGPDAQVYTMSKDDAERVELGLAKGRTGLQLATQMPPTAATGGML